MAYEPMRTAKDELEAEVAARRLENERLRARGKGAEPIGCPTPDACSCLRAGTQVVYPWTDLWPSDPRNPDCSIVLKSGLLALDNYIHDLRAQLATATEALTRRAEQAEARAERAESRTESLRRRYT